MPWKKSTRAEIVHIVVTGYQKKKQPSKYYVFVIDVNWNNSERFEVYRRYSDFFSFQTTLKTLFPGAAGKRGNGDRVIPQLPKRIFVGRSHVAKVAEARLEQINRYCQTLISLEPRISESAHVMGFFSPRRGDMELPKLHLHRPASLHPEKIPIGTLFEEYCALAEYVAEDSSQISFMTGNKVLVMSKDESGWWMCRVDGRVGWAPPSYLKQCNDTESDSDDEFNLVHVGGGGGGGGNEDLKSQADKDSDDSGMGDNSASEPNTPASTPANSLTGFMAPEIDAEAYIAIDSYQADGPGQVSFELGDTIHVLDKLEDGWWFVSNGKDEGWAPCSYLDGDKEEEATTNLEHVEKYLSVDDYEAEEEDEISFPKGVTMDVLRKSLDGWWTIKMNELVGLAPATFLKKLENLEHDYQIMEHKTSSPPNPLSSLTTFQQPPRKQSVRARASVRNNRPGRSPASSSSPRKTMSILPPIPADRPFMPLPQSSPVAPVSPEVTPRRNSPRSPMVTKKLNLQNKKPEMMSPELSDSDPEDNYLNCNFQQLAMNKAPLPPKRPLSLSGSESSMSEDSTCSKPPVATPRKHRPATVIKTNRSPPVTKRALSMNEMVEATPALPPRPSNLPPPTGPRLSTTTTTTTTTTPTPTPTTTAIAYKVPMSKHMSIDEPSRPKQRPRMSEIKRAKDRAKVDVRYKKTPSLSVLDEDGLETMSTTSGRSSKSTASYISSKSAPSYGNHDKPKKRSMSSSTTIESGQQLLAPQPPVRHRRRSENDPNYRSPSPDPVPRRRASESNPNYGPPSPDPHDRVLGGGQEEDTEESGGIQTGRGLNSQVADTLLKYIISSEDSNLKAALRELLNQDSEVISSIHSST